MGSVIPDHELPALGKRLQPYMINFVRAATTVAVPASGGASAGGNVLQHDLGGPLHTGALREAQAPWAWTRAEALAHIATPDAHHARQHSITAAADHTVAGSVYSVIGLSATNTLGVLPTTTVGDASPNTILRSSTGGGIRLSFLTTPLLDSLASVNMTLAPGGDLIFDPVGNIAKTASSVSLQSDNYASQTTGWRATYDGQADFRYLFVDEMHAKSFIADLEQALAGGQIICKSVAMVYSTFTAPAAGGSTTLTVRDLPSATGMAVFVNGDIVRLRKFTRSAGSLTIADCWGVVTLDTSYGTSGFDSATKSQRYTFVRSSGGNAGTMTASTTVAPDAIVLDYGTTGNGFHEVNAIDGAYGANSPYSQIVTWTTHPATGQSVRVRIGNLAGLSVADYGVRMGTSVGAAATTTFDFRASTGALTLGPVGSGKPNLHFDGTDLHMRQNTTNVITLASSGDSYFSGVMTIGTSGEIRQGTGTLGSNYTGLRIWRDSSVGRIAGYNTNVLQWYAATDGKLYAGAGSTIIDANGISLIGDSTNDVDSFLDSKAIIYQRSSGELIGRITGYYLSGSTSYGLIAMAESPDTETAYATFGARRAGIVYGGGTANYPRIEAASTSGEDSLTLFAENIKFTTATGPVSGTITPDYVMSFYFNGNEFKVPCKLV